MNAYSITAPEEIAKEYGGNKKKIQQAAAQGLINPTEAVMAGMFIDRMRNAAQAEQAQQPTVAEQVMNPQPQMPPQGMAATPQAQQMPQQAQMGAPQAPQMQQPQGMAMGGGLDSIPYNEGDYAEGGIVSFAAGDPVRMGVTDDQLRNMSRAQLRAVASNGQIPPHIRNAASARLQSITPAPGQQPTVGGLAAADLPRVPNVSGAMDRVGQAIMGTGDVDRNIEVSDAGITPRGSAGSSPDLLSMGVETFADGMVSRPDQGQRIDPNRFDTGTLTEAEARRIEGSEGGLFDALRKGANAMFGAADVAKEVPIDRSGQKVDMGGKTLPNTFQNRGGFSLADIYNEYAPRIKRSVMGAENQMDMPDPEGMLVTGFSGQDSVDANAYQSGTGDVPGPGPVEEAQARAARAVDTTIDDGDLRSMPFRDFDDGDLRSMPEEQTTLADQVEQVNKATEDLKPKTVEKDDPDAAKTALDAANDQADAMTKAAQTTADDEFSKRIEELMDPAAKGEFRKETEALVKNREERLKSAKKEAFSMALLQAGLGMLGQGGGQTALQALGKAALPATKDYAAAIKDAKKEDRELLQLGLSLEQMDAKEAAATKRVVAQLHGDRAKAMLTSATSMANNVRTTAASMYSADVTGRVGMAKADAMSEQARQTGALRQDLNRADNLRMERSELNDLVDKQAAALQEDPTYSMAKMIEQAAYAKLAKDPQNETLRAEFMLAQNEAQKAQEAFMASSPYAKLIQEQRGVVQSLGTSAVDFSSLNP